MESWLNQCQAPISKYEDSCRLERAIQELRQRIGTLLKASKLPSLNWAGSPRGLAQLLAQAQAL